jgi:hypothetical protein
MKKSFFFHVPLGVLTFLLVLGCKSTPSTTDSTIWELLLKRDSAAMGQFLGEVDVNARDADGRTPLHYAAELNDQQLAAFFLSIGANPDILDNSGQSALGISIRNANLGIARLIAEAGANIHLPINVTSQAGNVNGNDEEVPALERTSAALFALSRGPSIFRAILTPANIETVDANERTILHISAIEGNFNAVSDILAIPAASRIVNRVDARRRNALDYSLVRPDSVEHMKIAEQLVLLGSFSESPLFNYFGSAVRSANYNIRRNEGQYIMLL